MKSSVSVLGNGLLPGVVRPPPAMKNCSPSGSPVRGWMKRVQWRCSAAFGSKAGDLCLPGQRLSRGLRRRWPTTKIFGSPTSAIANRPCRSRICCGPWFAPPGIKLERRVGDLTLQHWANPACEDLRRGLLRRLSAALAPALFTDFHLFRHLQRFASGRLRWPFSAPDSRAIYDAFLAHWRSGQWRGFFLAKPVAARLLGTIVLQWLDNTAELLQRLQRDDALLGAVFAGEGVSARLQASRPIGPMRIVVAAPLQSCNSGER